MAKKKTNAVFSTDTAVAEEPVTADILDTTQSEADPVEENHVNNTSSDLTLENDDLKARIIEYMEEISNLKLAYAELESKYELAIRERDSLRQQLVKTDSLPKEAAKPFIATQSVDTSNTNRIQTNSSLFRDVPYNNGYKSWN